MKEIKEVTMKSDEMAKSLMAQLASQTMGIILQSRQEMKEQEIQFHEETDWLRMRVEDLDEELFAANAELENEKAEKAELEQRLKTVEKEKEQFLDWWLKESRKVTDLKAELDSIKRSDAATSDQKENVI